MAPPLIHFFFDYVDPASYLLDTLLLERTLATPPEQLEHIPLEVRPPPAAAADPSSEPWRSLHEEMQALAAQLDIPLHRPNLIPRSRKAHELAFHAREKGCFPRVHRALFEAHFVEGRDIGRVDVLVKIAEEHDLDRSETKATLDVDRFLDTVREERVRAARTRVVGVPTLLAAGPRRMEGFQGPEGLDAFLTGLKPHGR